MQSRRPRLSDAGQRRPVIPAPPNGGSRAWAPTCPALLPGTRPGHCRKAEAARQILGPSPATHGAVTLSRDVGAETKDDLRPRSEGGKLRHRPGEGTYHPVVPASSKFEAVDHLTHGFGPATSSVRVLAETEIDVSRFGHLSSTMVLLGALRPCGRIASGIGLRILPRNPMCFMDCRLNWRSAMSTKMTETDWAVALEVFRASLPRREEPG